MLTMTFFFVELEFMLGKIGAVETDIKENPRALVKDMMTSAVKCNTIEDSDSD